MSIRFKPLMMLIAKGIHIAKGEIYDFVRKNLPTLTNFMDMYNRFVMEYNTVTRPVIVLSNMLTVMQYPLQIITKYASRVNILRYGDEKGADSFAARYGYGEELISALKKMKVPSYSAYGSLVNKTGVGRIVGDLTELQCDIIGGLLLDPHPNADQRASAILKKLKSDLAKGDYPKEVKKELEADIARMEKCHETVNMINDDPNGPNIRKGIYDMVNQATDGHSDLREIFNFYFDSFRF